MNKAIVILLISFFILSPAVGLNNGQSADLNHIDISSMSRSISVTTNQDDYEPDNEISTATPLVENEPQLHNFHNVHDVDWFSFTVTSIQSVIIKVNATVDSDTYFYISLFGNTESEDLFVNSFNINSEIGFNKTLFPGMYNFKLNSNYYTGEYNVFLLFGDQFGSDDYEEDDSIDRASSINFGETQFRTVDDIDTDYVNFTVFTAGIISITLSIENLAIYLFDLNSGPLSLSETLVGNKFDPRYNHIKYVNPGEYSILLLSYTHIMHDFSISLNSFNSSGDITFETSLIGQLDVDEEIKLYRYQIDTLNTGIKIIPNSEVNYQMMTFREDGFMLDFLQLNHLNSNTRYSFYNKTGSYFLVLIEIPYFGVANFDLTIESFTIMHDLYEPDNDISTTNIITDGETQRHNILNNKYSHGNSHDFDVIGFNVNTFSLVSFNITASSFDIMVNLLDQNGNSIMHKKSTNFFGDKQIEFMALNNGHYYLQIYDSMYESYVDYNITMNVQSLSVDNYEPDDTQQTSTDLIQDETQTHYLDNSASTDQDWFKIVVGDSDQAQVNITIDRTFTYDYLDLELIDENGNSISLMSIELGDGSEMLYYAVVFGNQNYYLKVTSTYLVGVSGTGVFGLYTITYSSDVDSMVNNISSSSPSTSSSLNILFVPILLNLIIVHKVITKLNANKKN